MEQKKYLKWYNKVGYGSGDIAGNVVYALLSAFVMIFLTDTIGLNSGVVGTLIFVSKFFDGVSDIFFGSLIDKTKTKMGKARPWMLYGYFGCALCLIAIFCIPVDMEKLLSMHGSLSYTQFLMQDSTQQTTSHIQHLQHSLLKIIMNVYRWVQSDLCSHSVQVC